MGPFQFEHIGLQWITSDGGSSFEIRCDLQFSVVVSDISPLKTPEKNKKDGDEEENIHQMDENG